MDKFIEGYTENPSAIFSTAYISEIDKNLCHLNMIRDSEYIIIIFPLYADSMPGIVKFFIESLENIEDFSFKKIGFVVQSGFPEAKHSTYVEKYLNRLTTKLGAEYLGTVIKGGVEGIQVQPSWMTKKTYSSFYELGKHFSKTGEFDAEICNALLNPYQMSKTQINIFKFFSKTGLADFYWNGKLKKNGAFNERFDQPFISN